MVKYLFHFDIAVDNYDRIFSTVSIQLLRIDKYLRIFSKKLIFFQYGAKEERM